MKIIAHSTVPARPVYLHIAYLAATTMQNQYAGFLTIVIAALVLAYKLQDKRHQIRKVAIASVIILGGIVLFAKPSPYIYPELLTRIRAKQIHCFIHARQKAGDTVPKNVKDIDRGWHGSSKDLNDAWNQNFKIMKHQNNQKTEYRVISAGRDGEFDTKDDIYWPKKK